MMSLPSFPDPRRAGLSTRGAEGFAGRGPRASSFDPAVLSAILAFVFYVCVSLGGIAGRLLTVTYPLGCALLAILCYVRSPGVYIGFTFWLWLLTPFVRRVFDQHYGFHPTSTLLLAPLIASSFGMVTVIRRRRLLLRNTIYVPFVIAGAAVTYSFLIGAIRQALVAATYDLLTWVAPIAFGMHVALEWRRFPQTRAVVARAVMWGLLVCGGYGIWQFVSPTIWDRVWVVQAEMLSVGAPLPFLIRVFSTMNAPGPFSIMLIFSLLIGISAPQPWRALPLAVGLVALILTKGRSAWGAFVVGAVVIQIRQPLRALPRQWVVILGVLLLAAPLIVQPRFLSSFTRRAATLENLRSDDSFQARANITSIAFERLAQDPTGAGLGGFGGAGKLLQNTKTANALDSGPLEIYAIMGWIGGTLFMLSLLAIVLQIIRTRRVKYEPVTSAAVATVIALLFASIFGDIFNSVSGFFFWTALGFATAGRTYASSVDVLARYGDHPAVLARLAAQTRGAPT